MLPVPADFASAAELEQLALIVNGPCEIAEKVNWRQLQAVEHFVDSLHKYAL